MKSIPSTLYRPLRYCNRKYHFAITFPQWWHKYTILDRPRSYQGEIYLGYLFRYGGKIYEPTFTIIISPFGKKEWHKRYDDSPLTFLGEYKGHSYSYILPEELPDAFLKPDKSDYDYKRFGKQIRLLIKMVNAVPIILKSFIFI